MTRSSSRGTRRTISRINAWTCAGRAQPTVSGRLIVAAPAETAAATTRASPSGSERVASMALNCTSSV
jgi:hypothetical protein